MNLQEMEVSGQDNVAPWQEILNRQEPITRAEFHRGLNSIRDKSLLTTYCNGVRKGRRGRGVTHDYVINQCTIKARKLEQVRIKICCNELPTCANLKKRKPDLYDENWRCNFCKIEEETFDHFWKCSKIQNVVQDILIRLKIFLAKIIQEYSRDDIDIQELKVKINELEFKVLIWEPRNELQIKEEKQCSISVKDKAKSHSKRTEVGVKNVGCNMLESNWNKWNDLAFHRSGHWANF
ncbi:unnamed protein product [Rhizophagus irregularis]|nr:unnamed protein product [Rhizophagus irregularis]